MPLLKPSSNMRICFWDVFSLLLLLSFQILIPDTDNSYKNKRFILFYIYNILIYSLKLKKNFDLSLPRAFFMFLFFNVFLFILRRQNNRITRKSLKEDPFQKGLRTILIFTSVDLLYNIENKT